MIKNQIKSSKPKNKFITIILSVIFTMLFVFAGVKASSILKSDSLSVTGAGTFTGAISAAELYVPSATAPKLSVLNDGSFSASNGKFTVDTSGNVIVSGNLTLGGDTLVKRFFNFGEDVYSGYSVSPFAGGSSSYKVGADTCRNKMAWQSTDQFTCPVDAERECVTKWCVPNLDPDTGWNCNDAGYYYTMNVVCKANYALSKY